MSGKIERWVVEKAETGSVWCACSNRASAEQELANANAGVGAGTYTIRHLREVDPDHDAAVARLVEAARRHADYCLLTDKEYQAKYDIYPNVEEGHAREAATRAALSALPAPVSAEPAKGVRCWRSTDKHRDADAPDRYRQLDDGRAVAVFPSGRLGCTYSQSMVNGFINRGEWVECPDTPYVAPPVAAPSPAMPPDGPPIRWEAFNGLMYELRDDGVYLIRDGGVAVRQSAPTGTRDTMIAWMDADFTRIPPTPAAMETVDACAERHIFQRDDTHFFRGVPADGILRECAFMFAGVYGQTNEQALATKRGMLAAILTARDAAWQARHAAEVARLDTEYRSKIVALESDLARLSAAGGVDRELLETARACMSSMLIDSGDDILDPNWIMGDGTRIADKMATRAVVFARALHAALTAPGEVGNG